MIIPLVSLFKLKNLRQGIKEKANEKQMEKLIGITASLPSTSKARLKLSQTIVDGLWESLQHPPMSYMGDKFKYRQPDGSLNVCIRTLSNIHFG
jgi:hypothetical protein